MRCCLILTCIQKASNNPVKATEALKESFIRFEAVESIGGGASDFIERVEMAVAKGLSPQDFPDAFLRVALRGAWRQMVEAHVLGKREFLCGMPGGLIHKHQNMFVEMALGNFF